MAEPTLAACASTAAAVAAVVVEARTRLSRSSDEDPRTDGGETTETAPHPTVVPEDDDGSR